MPKIQLSDLKITKMTSEGWVIAPLSESPYYRCLQYEEGSKESKEIFLDYIKTLFEYYDDWEEGRLHEISYNGFIKLYRSIKEEGFLDYDTLGTEDHHKIDIVDNQIHNGQHRLAIWMALGNKYLETKKI